MTYKQARADFEYLETLAPLDDQAELDSERGNLMKDPTKRLAGELYEAAIGLWFGEHMTKFLDNNRVGRIARKYEHTF